MRSATAQLPQLPGRTVRGLVAARPVCLAWAVILGVVGVWAATPARADLGAFEIREFHTDLFVRENSDLEVVERMVVQFSSPRHGIYRSIPTSYTDPTGYRYSFGFRVEDVTNDAGRSHKYKVTKQGRYYKIRIGDPDRKVSGQVTYIIRYNVENALGHHPQYDEIYWNATGSEWKTRIRKASTTVHLPGALAADSTEAWGYTGRFGSRERAVTISHPGPQQVRFDCTRVLESLEGMTVSVVWPHGYVDFPGPLSRAWRFARDNWIILAPFFWFGFLLRRYRKVGKDPPGQESVVVQYAPPEGLTPAEIGTVIDEKVDLRDITATVVDLAVRGFLTIREDPVGGFLGLFKSTETVFVRNTERVSSELKNHEAIIFEGVFAEGDEVTRKDLKQKFYRKIPKIKTALHGELVKAGLFRESAANVRNRYAGWGFLAGIVTFLVGLASAYFVGGIFPHAAILPGVAGVLSWVLFMAFSPAMPQRTRQGVRKREWALGFQEFVRRVEADRLERDLSEQTANRLSVQQVFEQLLPYAMALGVASTWAKKFRDLYREESPTWYHAHNYHSFDSVSLEDGLSSSMGEMGSSMASSPRSSGSSGGGGGGFSGGGGGGGGGGSW